MAAGDTRGHQGARTKEQGEGSDGHPERSGLLRTGYWQERTGKLAGAVDADNAHRRERGGQRQL